MFAAVQFNKTAYNPSERSYTYEIPLGMKVSIGDIVQVPVNGGKRFLKAIVGEVSPVLPTHLHGMNIDYISTVLTRAKDDDILLKFVEKLKERYTCFSKKGTINYEKT